jgi:hypothetical protein
MAGPTNIEMSKNGRNDANGVIGTSFVETDSRGWRLRFYGEGILAGRERHD